MQEILNARSIMTREGMRVMKQISLTEGNIWNVLLRFSIPFLLANLLQALYGAVDLMVIGVFCSADSIAAVSTGTQVTQIITSLISGLTVGGTILVAKYTGMGKLDKVAVTIGTTILCFAFFALVLTAAIAGTVSPVLRLLQVPEASMAEAYWYVLICSTGIFFICEYNALCAVLRGYGDSLSPLLFAAAACVCNVAGDVFTVGYLHMGAAGTAVSTVLSQGVSMVLAFCYLHRRSWPFGITLRGLKMNKKLLKELVKVGVPVSFQECMVRISFLYLTAIINSLGVYAASAVGIAGKFDVFAMLPATSISSALTALTAQNIAAGRPDRAKRFVKDGIYISLACAAVFFLWAQLHPESMIGLFSKDTQVVVYGIRFLKTCSLDYLAVSVLFSLNAYLNGCEKTVFTMINCGCGALLIRVPILFCMANAGVKNLTYYGLVSPFSSVVMITVVCIYVKLFDKHTISIYDENIPLVCKKNERHTGDRKWQETSTPKRQGI